MDEKEVVMTQDIAMFMDEKEFYNKALKEVTELAVDAI